MQHNILADDYGPKIKKEFVQKLTKGITGVNKYAQVLHFGPDWSFEELLRTLEELNPQEYQNIFVIVIESQNFDIFERIKASLDKFGAERPLIIQLTLTSARVSKFYYKDINSTTFLDINPQEKNQEAKIFWSFLSSQNEAVQYLATTWMDIIKLPFFMKFLKLFENLFFCLILEVTKNGTKADLLKILEAPVENEGRVLSFEAQSYLSKVLYEKQPENQPAISSDDSASEPEDDSENKSEDEPEENQKTSSVLLTAIEHVKTEIIDYLITYWTHLIQQLPAIHQLQISTTAFKSNQLDVLCDLLDIADFPFPEDFDPDDEYEHQRLQKITLSRLAFNEAIKKGNFEKINKFIDSHSSLKYVYSIDNYPALSQAIEFKKFGVFYYLKSLGFEGEDCQEIFKELSKEDKQKFTQQAVVQRKANVRKGSISSNKSVMMLATRSRIHNRKTNKEREEEYHQKILNWLKDIHKVAPEMLEVAASCERLKIIFDFESTTVENASLEGPNSLGSTYPASKWIFIGAKLSDQLREQKIKGVLAHELCHYVMRLVYENEEKPYFEDREDVKEMFEEITNAINKWIPKGPNEPDDECNGIISTVFTLYEPDEFHLELIVRVVHILTEFDDDEDKTKELEEKYQNLFNFWHQQVVPDLQKFLQKNHEVIKLNRSMELLQKIQKVKNLEFVKRNDLNELTESKLAVATTNVPKLFLLEIIKNFESKDGKLIDSRSLFIDPEKLKSDHILDHYTYTCSQVQELTVFADISKGFSSELINQIFRTFINFVFVVSNEEQSKKLKEILLKKDKDVKELKMNYEWNDLTQKSQKFLLENKKINFQNNSQMSMMEFFEIKSDNLPDLSEVINAVLLNMLMNDEKISINFQKELNFDEKQFKFLNIKREFLKKAKTEIKNDDKSEPVKISQKNLLDDVKNNKFVLISDKAGNGKSYAMKNFSKIISKRNPTSWVTYVDLKQFIKEFKAQAAQQVMPEFSSFMAEKILKPKQKFEAKIFKKLYKDGKVFIFLDGFDEIAPDCAEFVSNLAQSFEQNGGNQLWIATRDYFEVDLMTKLGVDVAYGLDEMMDWQGIEMIAKKWILMDLGEKIKSMALAAFNNYVEDSSDYKKYEKKARKIVKKIKTNDDWFSSVGMPQMYKMIADGFKNEQNLDDLTRSQIYDKYIESKYSRWINETGEIRSEENLKSQRRKFNFWTFHQFHAIATRFPKLAKILFPGYDGKDLRTEHLVRCGIVSIKNGKIYFLHETLREFFIAKVLAEALKNEEINEKVVEVLVDILTLEENKVIRMFLNDIIEPRDLLKTQPKMKKFEEKIINFEIFKAYFNENLENLVDFYFLILKNGEHEKVKSILERKSSDIASKYAKSSTTFSKFHDFLFEFLNCEDLKNLIKNQEILGKMIQNKNLGFDVFTDFVLNIEIKFGFKFAQEELKRAIYESWINNNQFNFIFNVKDQKTLKFQKFMKMIQKFLSPEKILKFLNETDKYGRNILFECVTRKEKEFLEILWIEIGNYFASQEFKEFVKKRWKRNILHQVAKCENLKIHEVLWKLLLNTFENREELKDFVLQKHKYGNNFIHRLVQINKNPKIIEWNSKNLKQNFNNLQFQEIFQSRGFVNRNLLHSTADCGQKIEVFKLLWQEFRSSCKSEQEFLKVIKEIDKVGKNILNCAAWKSPVEVFNFLIEEFEKNCSKEEIKKMLCNSDIENESLLHHAASNESEDVFKAVWKKFQEYLTKEEILEITKQVNIQNEENFLFLVKSSETFEFAIKELEIIAKRDEIKIMLNNINNEKRNILQKAVHWSRKPLNFHESLWKVIKKYFEKSEIFNLINNVDVDGKNVFHITVTWETIQVIEFTWNEIKSILIQNKIIAYLRVIANDQDLLYAAYTNKNSPEIYDYIKSLLSYYEEMKEFENIDDENMEIQISTKDIEQPNIHLKLIEAVKQNKSKIVKNLLKKMIDISKTDSNQMTAADYAYLNYKDMKDSDPSGSQISNQILIMLLQNNSKFPSWKVAFDYDDVSSEVCEFIDLCEGMHKNLDNKNIEDILKVIKDYPNLRYFYDRKNESLMLFALKRQNFDFLNKINGEISINEEESLKEIYYEYTMETDDDDDEYYDLSEPKLPPVHIVMLISKSVVINSQNLHMCRNHIANAFKSLDEFESCSKILKIAAICKELKIIFDFSSVKNDFRNQIFDENEKIHESVYIYIAAKELLDVRDRKNVLGELIHELCHLAMFLAYMNNSNPYSIGESEEKKKYERIFNKIKEKNYENRKIDFIIKNAFFYEKDKQHSELIVKPYQQIIYYHDNIEKLNQVQKLYSALFEYIRDFVEPELDKALPVLKKLLDEKKYLKFEDLTVPLKLKLMSKKIIFQKIETTLEELTKKIDNIKGAKVSKSVKNFEFHEVLGMVSTNDIRQIILKDKPLDIGTKIKFELMKEKSCKKFIKISSNELFLGNLELSQKETSGWKTIEEIFKISECNEKFFWISFINLKNSNISSYRYLSNFEMFLIKILNIDSETETKFFKYFYRNGMAILIFDGIEEVKPECINLVNDMFLKIIRESKNQLWVSVTP